MNREVRAMERSAMPYTSIYTFPDFSVASLPLLMILPSGQPSIEKARSHPRLFIEDHYIRPFRTPHFARSGVYCGDEHFGKTMAAYSDIRQSRVYPRLTARIESEVIAIREGWLLMVRTQHGNQESLGGIFGFGSYRVTCLHVAAWIWFSRCWIGDSWEENSTRYRVWTTKSIETLDLSGFSTSDIFGSSQTATDSEEEQAVVVLEHLFSLQ
jgi:hypothetical protein